MFSPPITIGLHCWPDIIIMLCKCLAMLSGMPSGTKDGECWKQVLTCDSDVDGGELWRWIIKC